MGRPLYSSAFNTSPAVRDPDPPTYEKWSYLNAFDPDSDEFFDNEDAVYEDFIDLIPEDEEDEDEEDRDMLVVRMGNASPITSESSLSDSDSPLAVGAEDPAHLVVDEFRDLRQLEGTDSAQPEPAVRVRLATRTLPDARWGSQATDSGRFHQRRAFATPIRTVAYHPYPQRDESLPTPTPSARAPVASPVMRRLAVATPSRHTPVAHYSMSPPSSSTPTLYSWARNATQSTGSPFTNPDARTSYTHLSPALIRIRDVTV